MKISVDRERCEGHGMCQDVAPQVFEVDEEGLARTLVTSIPAELEATVRTAARVCPIAAVTVDL
ncbi:ferredoxin [Streptomyces sp. NBC_01549]|uniref:ferredoxin n=1 Tax=Streptomyces sp. NBC_01549 TaxID=2975874 RepID=UPI0022539A1F|nr:ferredoxin [Streptomyces sp. NBC_01549]MCX4588248.1 ferredoxin [Streptomyces sp. NBC_01549]